MAINNRIMKLASLTIEHTHWLKPIGAKNIPATVWDFGHEETAGGTRIEVCEVPREEFKIQKGNIFPSFHFTDVPDMTIRVTSKDAIIHGFQVTSCGEALGYAYTLEGAVALSLQNHIKVSGSEWMRDLLILFFNENL